MCTAATTEEIADVCGPTSNLPTEGDGKAVPTGVFSENSAEPFLGWSGA